MSEAADAESVTIAAVPEQVRLARAFVAAVLGESHPCKEDHTYLLCHDASVLHCPHLFASYYVRIAEWARLRETA